MHVSAILMDWVDAASKSFAAISLETSARALLSLLREFNRIRGIAALFPESFDELERVLQCLRIVVGRFRVPGRNVALHALILLVDGSHPRVELVGALGEREAGYKRSADPA